MSRRERILARLKELGGDGPKRSLGQNFLISDTVIERILFAVRSEPFTDLVEVGPGLGALTEDLLALPGKHRVCLLELDRRFVEFWRKNAPAGVDVFEGDALRLDWRELNLKPGTLFVSNLPYQISSSLVIERSLEPAGITRMILMFQKEVATRLKAECGSKDYGLLTVIAQVFWDITKVCDASPRDFFPPPNVASRVLQFRRRKVEWLDDKRGSAHGFLKFAKAAFSQRRKLLVRNLENGWFNGDERAVARIEAWLEANGFTRTVRAEELDPDSFTRLYLAMESGGDSV